MALYCHLEESVGKGAEAPGCEEAGLGPLDPSGGISRSWDRRQEGGTHRGSYMEKREAPLRLQLEEIEVSVIQAIGRSGINPADFLLGTLVKTQAPSARARKNHGYSCAGTRSPRLQALDAKQFSVSENRSSDMRC